METNQTPIKGYYLVLTEHSGEYDSYWTEEVKSYFIEKNQRTYMTVRKILREFKFTRRNDHYVPNVDLLAELMDYNYFHAMPKSIEDSLGQKPYDMSINLYEAVKIGDEVFQKMKIFDGFRLHPPVRGGFRRRD